MPRSNARLEHSRAVLDSTPRDFIEIESKENHSTECPSDPRIRSLRNLINEKRKTFPPPAPGRPDSWRITSAPKTFCNQIINEMMRCPFCEALGSLRVICRPAWGSFEIFQSDESLPSAAALFILHAHKRTVDRQKGNVQGAYADSSTKRKHLRPAKF